MLGQIRFWILCTMCVMNNEAYMHFSDDLDYASVSGVFIPINSHFKIQTSDTLSARSTDKNSISGIEYLIFTQKHAIFKIACNI